ncbi:MAG: hypothetical protein R3Y28_01440 [Candidatus Gastranaerophilales bacterium]
MDKLERFKKLTTNKDRRVTLMFTDELWETFKTECEKEHTKPTPQLEIMIYNYLNDKGCFDKK